MTGDSPRELDERRFRDAGRRGAPLSGSRQLSAILPNGRVVWLRVARPLAPATSIAQLAHAADSDARWRQAGIRAQSGAIARLTQTVEADIARLEKARLERTRALRRKLLAQDLEIDRRLTKEAEGLTARIERDVRMERETVRRLRRRDFWDKIVIASSLPLFAAYGERNSPFGANNLTLVLSLLIWLVGDDVVESIFGTREKSPYLLRDADAWSYLAPIGNVLAAWWLLGDRQHRRFITGASAIKLEEARREPRLAGALEYRYHVRVDISGQIAPDHWPDFETFTGVRAVATIRSSSVPAAFRVQNLGAHVEAGRLVLTFQAVTDPPPRGAVPPAPTGVLDVAWMVDAKDPKGDCPT